MSNKKFNVETSNGFNVDFSESEKRKRTHANAINEIKTKPPSNPSNKQIHDLLLLVAQQQQDILDRLDEM